MAVKSSRNEFGYISSAFERIGLNLALIECPGKGLSGDIKLTYIGCSDKEKFQKVLETKQRQFLHRFPTVSFQLYTKMQRHRRPFIHPKEFLPKALPVGRRTAFALHLD
jgi:hypothetical protein